MKLLTIVGGVSLIFSILSFSIYFLALVLPKGQSAPLPTTGEPKPQGAIADAGALVLALGKLAESLRSAGPGITNLVATILFLLIAALCAGLS
jgi:hypothetical protein